MIQLIVMVLIRRFLRKVVSGSLGKSWAGLIGLFFKTNLPLLVINLVNSIAKSLIFFVKHKKSNKATQKKRETQKALKHIEKRHALYRKCVLHDNDLDRDIHIRNTILHLTNC